MRERRTEHPTQPSSRSRAIQRRLITPPAPLRGSAALAAIGVTIGDHDVVVGDPLGAALSVAIPRFDQGNRGRPFRRRGSLRS